MLTGTFLSSGTAAVVCLWILVGAVVLDVSGLTTLVARGERARYEWVISWLARVGAECTHRAAAAAAAAASPTRTPPSSPGSTPASSAASSGRSVVPGLEAGGGEGAVCVSPPQPACGGGLYAGPTPIRVGEWGCTTGMWGRSVAMRKLAGTSPFHSERVGP